MLYVYGVILLKLKLQDYVQKHIPERIPVHPLQYRQQTSADLGQEGEHTPELMMLDGLSEL